MNQTKNLVGFRKSLTRLCCQSISRQRFDRCLSTTTTLTQKPGKGSTPLDEPVPFSQTEAKSWQPLSSFTAPKRDRPWYQPHSIVISFTLFLIYFCFLREENDLDEAIGRDLYSRMPGLEEVQIVQSIQNNRRMGMSTEALEARLKEIKSQQ